MSGTKSIAAGAATAIVGLVLVGGLTPLRVEAADAQWFTCSNGQLETSGNPANKARCRVTHAPPGCPIGMQLRMDFVNNVDHCSPPMGPSGEVVCPPGQQVQRVPGRDQCISYAPVRDPG